MTGQSGDSDTLVGEIEKRFSVCLAKTPATRDETTPFELYIEGHDPLEYTPKEFEELRDLLTRALEQFWSAQ